MAFNDKCAVSGVFNHKRAAFLNYLCLYALQHRGQEGAGIVSLNEGLHISCKDRGLVGEVFSKEKLKDLKGEAAIGHTRYSTTGVDELQNIQPLSTNLESIPLSVAHNGNIVNHKQVKEKYPLKEEGSSDTSSLFASLSHYLKIEKSFEKALA